MTPILRSASDAPCVSVLVPCYNVERYVAQCLDGLVGQTLRDIEIICINDGSTDGTREILGSYAARDDRIRIIDKPNTGYGHSMNRGLDAARGRYIGIVEPDDFVSPEMCESLYRRARRYRLDVVKANYFNHIDGQDRYFVAFAGFPYEKVFDAADYPRIMTASPSIWAGIYRRAMLADNGIRFLETPGASYQDTGFILKVWLCAKRVMLARDAFVHYRCDNPDASVKSSAKLLCVREETRSVEEFMQGIPRRRRRKMLEGFDLRCFDVYRWNYNRLPDDSRPEFFAAARDELAQIKRRNEDTRLDIDFDIWNELHHWVNDSYEVFREIYPENL